MTKHKLIKQIQNNNLGRVGKKKIQSFLDSLVNNLVTLLSYSSLAHCYSAIKNSFVRET